MKVKDILYTCNPSVKVAIVDLANDLYIFPPDSVGFWLYPDHWVHDAEVTEISIKDNVLVIGLEVE